MTDLQRLIEAVEIGGLPTLPETTRAVGGLCAFDVEYAMDGSLDAAKDLHEGLLPGWRVGNLAHASACMTDSPDYWTCWIVSPSYLDDCEEAQAMAATPARAWLLAILKAYQAQTEAAQ